MAEAPPRGDGRADEADESPSRLGTDAFISYAREDRRFVGRLHDAFAAAGRSAWVDWEGIPPSAKWMAEVRAAIEGADCFCFVISPDSVESPVCREEAAHAAAANKRIVPLLARPTDEVLVPTDVATHNWIDFTDEADFEQAFDLLARAVATDPEHVRAHTSLLVRATDWDSSGRDRAKLLRGSDLAAAEAWLAAAETAEPRPTGRHAAYVLASRRAATRRTRAGIGAVVAVLVVSLVLTTVAVAQRGTARRAQAEAEAQRDLATRQGALATSQSLAARSAAERETDLDRSLLLAVEAFRTAPTAEARGAMLNALEYSDRVTTILGGDDVSSVNDLAYSPDGTSVAVGSQDGSVSLWDVAARSPIGEPLRGEAGAVFSLDFSPDGTLLAAGGDDGLIVLWDVAAGRALDELRSDHRDVRSLDFSPDGSLLASGGLDGSVVLWNVATRRPVDVPQERNPGIAWSVAFDPAGTVLASVGDFEINLYDVRSRRPIGTLSHFVDIQQIAFSPDGSVLASADEAGLVTLWDVAARRPVGEPLRGAEGMRTVAFSPDGSLLAAAGDDDSTIVWDVETGRPIETHEGRQGGIWNLAFSPDGSTLATGGNDGSTILWDMLGERALVTTLDGRIDGYPLQIAYGADGERIAAGTSSASVNVWDVPLGSTFGGLPGGADDVLSLAFSGDVSRVALGRSDGTVTVRDLVGDRVLVDALSVGEEEAWSVALSPDGSQLAYGTAEGSVVLWDIATGRRVDELLRGSETVFSLAYSADGALLAAGRSGGWIDVWDLGTRRPVGGRLPGGDFTATDLAFAADGSMLASVGDFGPVVLWDVKAAEALGELSQGGSSYSSVAFSPDGSTLVTAGESIALWDVATQRAIGEPLRGDVDLTLATISPDGTSLGATGADGSVVVWDVDPTSWLALACTIANRNLTISEWDAFVGAQAPYRAQCPQLGSVQPDP